MGGCIIGNPTAGNTQDIIGHSYEQVFVIGCNHSLLYNTQDSFTWSGFITLGTPGIAIISNPVVGITEGRFHDFHLEVFVVGADHAVYYNREDSLGVWSGFIRLGGNIIGDAAVSFTGINSSAGFHTELVVVGSDNALYLNRQEIGGAWTKFARLGGIAISNPALARNAPDERLQIFVVGSDHAIYTTAETAEGSGIYSGFANLGGYVIGNPAVGRQQNALLDVFAIGSDHAIYVNRQANSPTPVYSGVGIWNGFENLGGSVVSDPVVTQDNYGQYYDHLGQINVFIIGSDHSVYHLTQVGADGERWAFEGLGGNEIGDPGTGHFLVPLIDPYSGVVLGFVPFFELFVVGSDQSLYYNQSPSILQLR